MLNFKLTRTVTLAVVGGILLPACFVVQSGARVGYEPTLDDRAEHLVAVEVDTQIGVPYPTLGPLLRARVGANRGEIALGLSACYPMLDWRDAFHARVCGDVMALEAGGIEGQAFASGGSPALRFDLFLPADRSPDSDAVRGPLVGVRLGHDVRRQGRSGLYAGVYVGVGVSELVTDTSTNTCNQDTAP
jgi:hypothetical protein